jgi:hypothetical protein
MGKTNTKARDHARIFSAIYVVNRCSAAEIVKFGLLHFSVC